MEKEVKSADNTPNPENLENCESVMKDSHEHDWKPDGDSYLIETCGDECDWQAGVLATPHRLTHPDHYKRVRRYTCHCGASKTVDLGEKQ